MDSLNVKIKDVVGNQLFDFHSSDENVISNIQHPIFKTLLKLEFEKAIRNYLRI